MKNLELIEKFCRDKQAESISKRRLMKYRYTLIPLSKHLNKDFDKASMDDLKTLLINLENSKYKPNTIKDFKIILRLLYRWLKQDKKVDWIKIKNKEGNHKLPEELLTQEDIKKLIEVADIQDKCLISLLYESGMRAGEFLSLKLKHIKFDDNGAIIIIPSGKTGSRRIRIYDCVLYLKDWINSYSDNPESSLFITKDFNRGALSQVTLSNRIKDLARKSKLQKRIHPHLFRHSRATFLANYLTQAQLCNYFGWVQGTKMAGIYIHLSGAETDDALLSKVYKVKQVNEEARDDLLKPKLCSYCNTLNVSSNAICKICNRPLTIKAKLQFQEEQKIAWDLMNQILDDEMKSIIKRKIEQLKNIR